MRLEGLPGSCVELRSLTQGHDGGIFIGQRSLRTYVVDPAHGVPFLSSSSMLHADFTHADLLKKTDAARFAHLRIEEGMTLVSAPGPSAGWCTRARRWSGCGRRNMRSRSCPRPALGSVRRVIRLRPGVVEEGVAGALEDRDLDLLAGRPQVGLQLAGRLRGGRSRPSRRRSRAWRSRAAAIARSPGVVQGRFDHRPRPFTTLPDVSARA